MDSSDATSYDVTDFISIDEASYLSGYSKHHLRRLVNDGRIHARKLGTFWLVYRDSLFKYIQTSKARHPADHRFGPRKGGDPPS